MAADGSIVIDTKIDSSSINDIVKQLQTMAREAAAKVDQAFKEVEEAIAAMGDAVKKTENPFKDMEDQTEDTAETIADEMEESSEEVEKDWKESFDKSGGYAEKFVKVGKSVAKGIKTAFDVAVKAIAVTGTAITAASALGISYNMEMENYLADFTVMLGDTEKAAGHLEKLKKMAAKTPFEMTDLAQADKILLAFGSDAEAVQGQLQMLGDISLGNSDKLGTIATAFGRIQSNGRASMEEINMMIDAGFNPLNIIAEQTGETMEEVRDRVSKGAVSFEEISDAMKVATSEGGQFYKGMEVASKTASGQISTLKDNVNALLGDMTKGLFDGMKDELLPRVMEAVEDIHTAFNEGGAGAAIDTAANILTEFIGEIAGKAPGAISTMLKTILPKIKAAGRTMILSLVEAMLGEDIAKQLSGVLDAVDEAFARLAGVIAEHADEIGEFITDIIGIILEIAEFALPILIDGISWLVDNLDDLEPVLFGVAAGFVAIKAVSAVQGIITGITGAFSALNAVLVANPVVATIGLIAGALGFIVGLSSDASDSVREAAKAYSELSEEQQKVIDKSREHADAWEELKEKTAESVSGVSSEFQYYQDLSEELKTIVDENGKIKKGYEERAKYITDVLSEALGIEVQIVDDQIEGYQELQSEIEKTIALKEAEAIKSAYETIVAEALQKQEESRKNYLSSVDILNKKQEQLNELHEDYNKYLYQANNTLEDTTWITEKYGVSVNDLWQVEEELVAQIEEVSQTVSDSEIAWEENKAVIQNYGELTSEIAENDVQGMADAQLKLTSNLLTAETSNRESLERQVQDQKDALESMKQAVIDGSVAITDADIAEQERRLYLSELELQEYVDLHGEKGEEAAEELGNGIRRGEGSASGAMRNVANKVKKEADISLYAKGKYIASSLADGMNDAAWKVANAASRLLSIASSVGRKNYSTYYYEPPTPGSGPGSDMYMINAMSLPDLPQLAKGTVIPPNTPYLAVVGDQKHGTNIEAPLDTIKQAVAEVLSDNGGSGSGGRQIVIPVYISGRQVYEVIVEENDMNTIATGRNALA